MMPNPGHSTNKLCSFVIVLLAICGVVVSGQQSPSPAGGTGLEGIIVIAPAHPGPSREGVSDTAPLAHAAFVVQKGDATIASFITDEKGAFRISLPPGHYTVSQKGPAAKIGHYGPFEVDVAGGQFTKVNWTCDTGMR